MLMSPDPFSLGKGRHRETMASEPECSEGKIETNTGTAKEPVSFLDKLRCPTYVRSLQKKEGLSPEAYSSQETPSSRCIKPNRFQECYSSL